MPPHREGRAAVNTLADAGVMMAYGSDLLGGMHPYQSDEFTLRARYLPAMEVIRSTTMYAAKALSAEGRIGTIEKDAHADLIVVDGDPLADLSLLTGQGKHLPLIMKGGEFMKQEL